MEDMKKVERSHHPHSCIFLRNPPNVIKNVLNFSLGIVVGLTPTAESLMIRSSEPNQLVEG
jgi:hypothetical protein